MELFCQVIIGSSVIYMEPIIGKVAKTETLPEGERLPDMFIEITKKK